MLFYSVVHTTRMCYNDLKLCTQLVLFTLNLDKTGALK